MVTKLYDNISKNKTQQQTLVERGRWVKPKINYCDRLCTLALP